MTDRLVLATANPDKVAEITDILGRVLGDGIELVPRPDGVGEVEEHGETLTANARLKAVAICDATGEPAVADDTGLEVDALGGQPGVHSARYAGEGATYQDNVARLLGDLDSTGALRAEQRRARFRTVALVRYPDGGEVHAEGTVEGEIAPRSAGRGGFGYDPVFVPDEGDGRTFAEMSAAEKHEISHRGRAFRALARRLSDQR